MKCHEKINFFVQILLPVLAVGEWRNLAGLLEKYGVCFLNRENFCVTEFLLLLPPPQDVSTHFVRST